MASCGGNTENTGGGKVISIRDQIGQSDSLPNGNSSPQKSNEDVLGLDKKSPLEQLIVMVSAAENKDNGLVAEFVNYDSLDFYGALDNFDYVLFDDQVPGEYSRNKRAYLTKNSYLLVPTFLKSKLIKSKQKNDSNSIESVTILKNKSGEYRFSTNLNGNQFLVNVSQDYSNGDGGGALIYRFHIGSDKRISLVHVMMAGGTVSF